MEGVVDLAPRLIRGTGPVPAEGMLIGEAGGYNEHLTGRPFIGKAGSSLSTYLLAAGVPRPDIFIDNLYPFWPGPGNPDPTADQIKSEEWRLIETIKRVQPKLIGTVGRISTQWFLGPDVTMETVHGIPHWSSRAPGAVVLPIYHPAAGFYSPEKAALCQDDILRFAYYLRNPAPKQVPPKMRYILVDEAPEWLEGAVDTEGLPHRPWGYSWSTDGRTTYVHIYKPTDRPPKFRGRIIFHNAMHDLPVLRAMGCDTREIDFDDTMVRLFNLQLEPQGLKAAAYRHLGLRMHEFDETVRPHFDRIALDWLQKAATFTYTKPKPKPVMDYAQKRFRVTKPWDAGRRIRAILKSYDKKKAKAEAATSVEEVEEAKLENSWKKLPDEFQDQAASNVGESFPEFAIFCVPEKEAVQYSGTDAGATLLLSRKTDTLIRARGLKRIYEMDRRCLPFVDRMQEVGLRVDTRLLGELETDLETIRERAGRQVRQVVGSRWFNPGSGDQVAAWLYDYRGLEPLKFTDTGRGSTSDEALKMLRGYNSDDEDVVRFTSGVQEYREADKYLGTFVRIIFDKLQQDKQGNWRVHPNFRVTRVVSGRLSSHEPNVLALPTRTDLGKRIRDCFVAGDGYAIVAGDLSQIELRTMAHLCRDQRMRQAFEQREDLHTLTATIVFKIPLDQFDAKGKHKKQRYVAKCFHPDTEVLTRSGWKRIVDLAKGEEVMQATPKPDGLSATMEWVVPNEVYTTRHPSGELVRFYSEGVEVSVTPDHRMLRYTEKKEMRVELAGDLAGSGYLLNAGWGGGSREADVRILRLAVATQADGSFTGKRIRFGFTKERKIERLRSLLKASEYKETVSSQGATTFVLGVELSERVKLLLEEKHFPFWWLELRPELLDTVLDEIQHWDSHTRAGWKMFRYTSWDRRNLNVVQAIASIRGRKSRIDSLHSISVKQQNYTQVRQVKRRRFGFTSEVACLSVPSTFVLVRDGGVPVITGQTINFAVMYGITAKALLEQLYKASIFNYTLEDCERFIAEWFKIYGSVGKYLNRVWNEAEKTGYVRDMWGRTCYIPNLRLLDRRLRESAQRLAGNFPVQSGAHGLVKIAEADLHDWIEASGRREQIRPWLQMHDELDLEVRDELVEEVKQVLHDLLVAEKGRFSVPIEAEVGAGRSWGSAK